MGYLCEVHCPTCGYEHIFKLGSGRRDYNKKRIYDYFDLMETWSIKVEEIERRSQFLTFQFRLGRCQDCGRLQAVPEVIFEDGATFCSKVCDCEPKKEHEMELIEDDIDARIKCPECSSEIHLARKGLWD